MSNTKLVMLIGKSGSGKDSIKKELIKNPIFHNIINTTTREKRDNETSVAYHFISYDAFAQKLLADEFLTAATYNGWGYATEKKELVEDKINIGVFNLQDLEILKSQKDIQIKIFIIDCDKKERLLRQLYREKEPNVDEIVRRYQEDEKDFKFILSSEKEYYYIDNSCMLEDAVQEIYEILKQDGWVK